MSSPRIAALILLVLAGCSQQKAAPASASASAKKTQAATATPTLVTINVDGQFADWQQVMLNPLQVTVDGNQSVSGVGCYPTNPDRDCEAFTQQRDVSRFAWTYDNTNIYTMLERPNTNATLTYSFVMDVDADGLAKANDRVLQVEWKTGGQILAVKLYAYVPLAMGGDPMSCPLTGPCPNPPVNPHSATGYVDGYTIPGTKGVLLWQPPIPVPSCGGSALGDECGGDNVGTRFEVFVPWNQLGVPAGSPIFWHVASSTNAEFNQAKDNVGGPDGKLGSFGVFGMDFTPDRNGFSNTPGTVEYCHVITNNGNFSDSYNLSGISSTNSSIAFFTDTGGCVAGTQMGLDANGDGDFTDVGDSINAAFNSDGDNRPNTELVLANATFGVVIRLTVPTGLSGSTDQLIATSRSVARPTLVFDNVTDRTKIGPVTVIPDLSLSGTPGVSVDFGPHSIRNNQAFDATFNYFVRSSHGYTVALYSDVAGAPGAFIAQDTNGDGVWDVATPNTGNMTPGATKSVWIRVTIPAAAPIGTVDALRLTLTSTTVSATTGSAFDTLTVLNGLTIGPSYTSPSSQLFGPAGTSVYLPHFMINSLQITNSVTLTQTGTLSAGYTVRFWTDPNGDGSIADGALITGPVVLAASGGTANFVTEVIIPAVPGSPTNNTSVTGTGSSSTTATANDHIAVGALQTFDDVLFSQPTRYFAACSTIYAKAVGLTPNSTTNYQLVYTNPPPTSANVSSNNLPTDGVGTGQGSYTLLSADGPGDWRVRIFAGAIQTYDLNPVVVERSGSVAPSGPATATNGQPLTVSALLTSTASQVAYTGTSVSFVVRDPFSAVFQSSVVSGIDVLAGGAATTSATWPNVTYPAYGNYTVTVTWNTSCGSVIAFGTTVVPYLPPAPTLLTPANNAFINTATPSLTGSAEPSATVNISIDGVFSGSVTATAGGAFSYTAPTQSSGAHTWSATQTVNTVTGPASTTFTFTVDLAAPAAPVMQAPANGSSTNNTTPVYSGTAEASSTVRVSVDGTLVCTTTATAGGAFSCNQPSALVAGTHTVNATATDAANNTSAASNTNTFTVDTTAPAAPVVSAPANLSFTNNTLPTYSGTAEAGSTVRVSVDGALVCTTTATAGGTFSCAQPSALAAGVHSVNATATDAATNVSAVSNTNTFTVDLTPPAAPVVTAPANGSVSNNTTPTYSGTADPGTNVTVSVDAVVRCSATTTAAGAFSCTQPTALAAGAHAVNAVATDAAGNTSPVSNTNIFTIDLTAPAAPVVTTPANGNISNNTTPTYSGTAEALSTVKVTVSGTLTCTVTATAAGTWSCPQPTPLADGTYSVNATATDSAGNVSAVSNTNVFTIETVAPLAPVVTAPANNSSTNNTTPTYSGTAEAGSTVRVSVDGALVCTTTSTAAGAFGCAQPSALGAGAHTVNATATDAANNVSGVSNTNTFTVDLTPPAAPVVTAPANGSVSNNTTPTYSGTAEPGSTVTVSVDGVVRCSATTTAGGAFSCVQPTALAAGSHTVNATATDAATNTSGVSNTNTFTIDLTAPAAPVVTTPANGSLSNNTTPTYSGTAEALSTVKVTVSTTLACTVTATAAGTWSCPQPTPLADGTYSVSATATDPSGNVSAVSNTNVFNIETVAPPAPVVTAPANGSSSNVATPTYTGTAEGGSTVRVSVDGTLVCTVTATVGGTFSCAQPTALSSASHTVNATATDAAGNISPISATNTFTVDTTPPAAPVVVAPANGSSSNDNTPTYSGTAEGSSTVNVQVDGLAACTTTAAAGGAWSCTPVTAIADGSHMVNATATDAATNVSPVSATNTFTIDSTPPAAPVVLAPANGSSSNDNTPTYSGTAEAGSTVNVRLDGNVVCTVTATAGGAWTCSPAGAVGEGSHTVNATATDALNNTSAASATNTFVIDTLPPAVPVVLAPVNGASTNDNTPAYSGTAEAGSTVTVRVDGSTACTATATAAGAWTCTPVTAVMDGSHTINAIATDAASNPSMPSTTNTFTVDTAAPAAPVVTAPANGSNTSDTSPPYSGTAEANSTVTVRVDGNVVCTVTATAGGAWTCSPIAGLTAGSHAVNATATDVATNVSVPSATNTFTVDTSGPAAPVLTAPANGSSTNNTTPTYTGTAENNATVTITIDGVAACSTTASAAGAFSCAQPTALTQGSHAAQAVAFDAAMNASPPSNTNTFTIDTTAPAIPVVVSPADGSTTKNPTPAYSGTAEANSTVTVSVDGATACTATATALGVWTCTQPMTLTDGSHTVRATARDAASNTSGNSLTNTFTVDTAAPAAPVVTAPANASVSSNKSPTYTGTAEANSVVTVSVDGATACTATATAAGAFSCAQPTPLADGSHMVNATATDVATNVSAASATNTFTVDTMPPAAPVISEPVANSRLNSNLPAYTGGAEANSTVTVIVDGTVACTTTASATGAWSCTQSTALADGVHMVSATAKDAANGVSPASTTVSFTVDTTPPDTNIVSGPPAMDPATAAVFDFSSEAGATFECSLDGAAFATCSDPATFSNLSVGMHTLQVRAKDLAGNVDPTPASRTWTVLVLVDTTIVSGPPALTRNAMAMFDFSSNTANVTYECSVDGSAFSACMDPVSYTVPDGLHTLRVRAIDALNNFDTTPAQHQWTVDTLPPGAPTITSPTNNSTVGFTTPVIAGTGEPGATVTIVIDGAIAGTAVVNAFGTWTFTPAAPLTNGMHTVSASAKDPAGNTGPSSVPVAFTIDPNVLDTRIVSGPAAITNSKTAVFDFESNKPNVTFECSLDGATFTACADPSTFSNLGDGPHTLLVRAKDGAGNVDASPASGVWRIITTLPAAPVVVYPANNSTIAIGTTTPIITGTAGAGLTVTVVLDGAVVGTTTADAAGNWSFTPAAPLAAGPHTVLARATDLAGNVSPDSATNSFIIDTSVLDTFIVSGPLAVSRFNSASFDLASNKPMVTYECSLDGAAFTACTDPATFTGLADGNHTLQARAKDTMGNVDPTPASYAWKVDTKMPVAAVVLTPANGATLIDNRPTVTGTAEPGATVLVSIDGAVIGWTIADANGKWSLPTTAALLDGSHTVSAVAQDSVGNKGPASATNTFTIVTTVLAPPTITTPVNGTVTNNPTPTITGKAPPNSTVRVFLDSTLIGTTTADANGDWTFIPGTAFSEGPHALTVQALKGPQTSVISSATMITIDTVAPTATITKQPPAQNLETEAKFEFSSNDPAATYECSVDGAAYAQCTPKLTLSGLALGMHTLDVRAVDAAGNKSAPANAKWTQARATVPPPPNQTLVGGGCGCSTTDPGALFALLGLAVFLRRRRS